LLVHLSHPDGTTSIPGAERPRSAAGRRASRAPGPLQRAVGQA
jgi:hypothetical protein